jgi:hypothetical protein
MVSSGDFDREFDTKVLALSYSYVVLTGRATNKCRYQGKPGCTDRTTDIVPVDVMKWDRSDAASGRERGQ